MATSHARLFYLNRAMHQPVTLYEHSCCGSVRWSGARRCDGCGASSEVRVWNVSLGQAMARLHRQDLARPAPEQPPPALEPQPQSQGGEPRQDAAVTNVRPPGARPHRWDEADEAAAVPAPPVATRSGAALPGAAVGLPLAVIGALFVGNSIPALMPPLVGIAAILLILFVSRIVIARAEE